MEKDDNQDVVLNINTWVAWYLAIKWWSALEIKVVEGVKILSGPLLCTLYESVSR